MNIALILAAGKSRRFGKAHAGALRTGVLKSDKLLAPILGRPLIYYTIQALHDHPQIGGVIIAASAANKKAIARLVKKYRFPRAGKIVIGGSERQDSLIKAFGEIAASGGAYAGAAASSTDIIIVHNAANPLVTQKEISAVIAAARKHGGAAVGGKITDTIKEIRANRHIKTHDREKLIAAQTPQAARYATLKKALQKAEKQGRKFTDESSLLENAGLKVSHVPASPENFKITTLHDYEHMKVIMGDVPKNFLVGIGQDSHEFSRTRRGLALGGLLLKNFPKLDADSDGDVILHAIYNALSQAIGEGSIGRVATPMLKEKGITKSGKYIETLQKRIAKKGYVLNNLGLMVEAKTPRMDPLVPRMKKSLSTILGLPERRIGITATSGESLTPFGRGRAVQCFAIVSLKKHEN